MISSKINNNIFNTILDRGIGNDLNSENTWNEGFCFLSRGFLIFERDKLLHTQERFG